MEFINNGYVQIVISSVAVYVFIIIAIRLFGKKELSQLSVIDLVFILLISNSVQNAMVGSNVSLSGGLAAAGRMSSWKRSGDFSHRTVKKRRTKQGISKNQ